MKTHSFSIWRLKEEIENLHEALKNPADFYNAKMALPGASEACIYYRRIPEHPPRWVELFKEQVPELTDLRNSGCSAVLLLRSSTGPAFAVTFGYGWQSLKSECYESNFGLRTVLNAVVPDKVRSVDANSLEGVPLQQRIQSSSAADLNSFGFDMERDMMAAATGVPSDDSLGNAISGKDCFKASVKLDCDSIVATLDKLEGIYLSERYKENFAWVDHLSEVRDRSTIALLDDILVLKLRGDDLTKTWLAVPETIEWSDVDCFRYKSRKRGKSVSDIDWITFFEAIEGTANLTPEVLKGTDIYCISQSSGQPKHSWSAYKCVYGEVRHEGATYALSNSRWFQVDANFLEAVNRSVDDIPVCKMALPHSGANDEETYNEATAASDQNFYALMDRKTISYGGGHSKIEFCDLYTRDRQMIHVKRYAGSSVLSHLFSQATVSARLLFSDQDFRLKLNEKLPPSHQIVDPTGPQKAADYEVVYAIMSNAEEGAFELPLFSKISLRNAAQTLRSFGVGLSKCIIPIK